MIRLNKYLADCGIGSRRQCDQLIQAGKVTVNNVRVTTLGLSIDESKDQVSYNDKIVHQADKAIYIILNKPMGYVTTVRDELGRKTVRELIPIKERIFPIGRLDKDTEGLLVFTNDGEIAYHLTHPKFEIEKNYEVTINSLLKNKDKAKLEQGVLLEDGMTAGCIIKKVHASTEKTVLQLIIHEGKKREIKRIFQALGYAVKSLKRIQFANLTILNLPVGKWRYLTDREVMELRLIAGINSGH